MEGTIIWWDDFCSCPSASVVQRIVGAGGGGRTYAKERGGVACLSAATRRRVDGRRCISLQAKAIRRWWSSFWRRGPPRTRKTR